MTDTIHSPLPASLDGEPDLAAEIARFDASLKELADQTNALKATADYAAVTTLLEELVSEEGRAAIPDDKHKLDRVFALITTALAENKRPVVPATDTAKPTLAPVAPDLSALPAHARIARGYRTA